MASPRNMKATSFGLLLWLVWGAMLASILVYVAVAFLRVRDAQAPSENSPEMLWMILFGMAVSNAIVSVGIRQIFLVRAVRKRTLDLTQLAGLQRAFTIFIVNWALSETAGIFGLLLVFLGASFWSGVPFWGLALVLMIFHRPDLNSFRRDASTEERASQPGPLH